MNMYKLKYHTIHIFHLITSVDIGTTLDEESHSRSIIRPACSMQSYRMLQRHIGAKLNEALVVGRWRCILERRLVQVVAQFAYAAVEGGKKAVANRIGGKRKKKVVGCVKAAVERHVQLHVLKVACQSHHVILVPLAHIDILATPVIVLGILVFAVDFPRVPVVAYLCIRGSQHAYKGS